MLFMDYLNNFIESKYHLSVARRMFKSYSDFEEKRFLVGVINELAKSSSCLIRAYLLKEKVSIGKWEKNLRIFMEKIGPKYLTRGDLINIFKTLEIEKAQKESHVEFARGDKIILLVRDEYKFLTSKRIEEFIESVENGIKSLQFK